MTHVIGQGCCNDASCVAVCPVQCIRPRPGDPEFTTTEQLYIDPASCIDCGACANVCPVEAIHHADSLPLALQPFGDINADYFAAHPLQDVSPPSIKRRRLATGSTLTVAIVGSGPSAMYAASELSEIEGCQVTVVERQPVPYGLVRAGVAPDHHRTKLVAEGWGRILRRPTVECLFNVEVGRDVTVQELLDHHHAVVWAAGSSDDRKLGIGGEDLPGVVSAREFVAWYNGHPDFAHQTFDLSGKRAVIIGNGNVALDVARALAQSPTVYERTSMSNLALKALRASAIEEVQVIGRRGQAHAAYGTAELIALSRLEGVDLLADPQEVTVTDEELAAATADSESKPFERRRAVVDAASRREQSSMRRVLLRFRQTPVELLGIDAVKAIVLTDPAGTRETVETSLVIRSVGFRGRPAPDLPFDEAAGVIPNEAGRITDPNTGLPLPGLYCSGWIKRGSTGVIGTNRVDSEETVNSLLEDVREDRVPQPTGTPEQLIYIVRSRGLNVVDAAGWHRIDEAEKAGGQATGRDRLKFLSFERMVQEARDS
ncbi:FAD-dependent oxidoreductase [Nocardioides sp. CN2-186]|uniref:FAD-dependent oxidoreductase n=1 Tax=Nocardioides tweenelious TaxID=3156607 RepID=UPI0032B4C059